MANFYDRLKISILARMSMSFKEKPTPRLWVANKPVMLEASYGRSLVTIKHRAGLKKDTSSMTCAVHR
jgi:hypothetical protein